MFQPVVPCSVEVAGAVVRSGTALVLWCFGLPTIFALLSRACHEWRPAEGSAHTETWPKPETSGKTTRVFDFSPPKS